MIERSTALAGKTVFAVLIAGLLASCSDTHLPNGYRIRVADRGKAWLHDPDNFVVLDYVTAVGHDDRRIFTETRQLRDEPPYGYDDCQYHVTDTLTRKTLDLPASDRSAIEGARAQIRRTKTLGGSISCLAESSTF